MAMMDVNGRELRTGDVVMISDSYFKNDNGLWFIESSPGDVNWLGDDYSLRRICKDGSLSTSKHNIAFWPLKAFCSDHFKNARAYAWNKEHAKIEIIDTVDRSAIRDYFADHAKKMEPSLERKMWDWGRHSAFYLHDEKIRRHYLRVAASIA